MGSACHLNGSQEIVDLFQKTIEEKNLEDEIMLYGSFCIGKCNRAGVTVQVDDEIYVGITPANFKEFFEDKILKLI